MTANGLEMKRPERRPSLQRTSKAPTKGAVKGAAMVKLPLLCPELVLQAMKVIFSGRQGKSADGWPGLISTKVCWDI